MSVSPLRLAATHWPLLAVCALSLAAGTLVLDDYVGGQYPLWGDQSPQRATGKAMLDYLAGDGERAFDQLHDPVDRYYGAVFEAPLTLVERLPGVDAPGDIHALMHLFFLAGGVFCYLLVLRLFGSKALAFTATVLFLLHPRIYANSFFNSKDVPFLVAFMIALYLAHRAFRRDTLGAFLLCGVGVGLLVNLRIMGIVLFAAVLALRALDPGGAGERKRALLTGGALALAAILTYYASLPVLWTDPPGRFAELLSTLNAHPEPEFNLFRGEWLYSRDGPPLDYVPVWVGITTPPATLVLALLGAVALAWRALRRPRDIIGDGPLRFGLLLAALPVATVVAVVVLESNVYQTWRQLYFLYAPLLLLAVFGLHWLVTSGSRPWPRAGAWALTGGAIAVALVSVVRIHPYQPNYFNVLADRAAPEGLSGSYRMGQYVLPSSGRMLSDALDEQPSGAFSVALTSREPRPALPARILEYLGPEERERLTFTREFRSGERNLLVAVGPCEAPVPVTPLAVSRLYGVTIACLFEPVAWFEGYRREARAREPLDASPSPFAVSRVGDVLVYVREGCSPGDMGARFFLRVHPVDAAVSTRPGEFPARRYGYERRDFAFTERGVRIDGDCVAVVPLPGYAIARIETGRFTAERAEAALRAVAGEEPLARARFAVWLAAGGQGLVYAREECAADDAAARFFLHVFPTGEGSLPHGQAEYGFDNLDFEFSEYGVRTRDGGCVATVPLPAYPIARIETGQYDDTGALWTAEFALPGGE